MCKYEHYGNCDPATKDQEYCIFHKPDKNEDEAREFYRKFLRKFKPRREKIKVYDLGETVEVERLVFEDDVDCRGYVFPVIPIFYVDFPLEYAIFKGKASFWRTVFKERTWISLSKEISFKGAKFKEVDFSEAIFEGMADFSNAEFKGIVRFHKTKFNGWRANFSEAVFIGELDFSWAVFNDVDFSRAVFKGLVNFNWAKFRGRVDFSWTVFEGDLESIPNREHYYQAKSITFLEGDVNFSGTVFEEQAHFSRTKFKGKANFWRAEFKEANFLETIFEKDVNFSEAVFSGEENFYVIITRNFWRVAALNKKLNFSKTIFKGMANFERTVFNIKTIFKEVKFEREAHFKWAEFKRDVRFETTVFKGDADFSGATFGSVADFTSNESLEKNWFYGNLNFSSVNFRTINIDLPSECFGYPQAEAEACRVQRISYEKEGKKDEADRMFVRERRALRRARRLEAREELKKAKGLKSKIVAAGTLLKTYTSSAVEYTLADFTCKYGTDWMRPILLWVIIVMVFFPSLYLIVGVENSGYQLVSLQVGNSTKILSLIFLSVLLLIFLFVYINQVNIYSINKRMYRIILSA